MRALFANRVEADFQGREASVEGLLVLGNQCQDALRRMGRGEVIDLLGRAKAIANSLEFLFEFGPSDAGCKARTIAKEQAFKFMNDDKRDEAPRIP